jgi:small subunit ribosomal protein S2
MIRREHQRLFKNLDGLRTIDAAPDVMFVIDLKREHNAVAEARRLRIPLVAIVDTNADPDVVDYPIAGNDDAIRSIKILLQAVTTAIAQGKAEADAKKSRRINRDEPPAAPAPTAPAAPAEVAAPAAA